MALFSSSVQYSRCRLIRQLCMRAMNFWIDRRALLQQMLCATFGCLFLTFHRLLQLGLRLVHGHTSACTLAGIGRTGTFCTLDIALQRLKSDSYGTVVSAAELKPVVAELRRQRAGMVQTPDQYLFCYQVLLFS